MPQLEPINRIVELISSNILDNVGKMIELQHSLLITPYLTDVDSAIDKIPFYKYQDNEAMSNMLKLYCIQLRLFFSEERIDYDRVEADFKLVSSPHLLLKSTNEDELYLRIVYHDILSDYQYLMSSDTTEFKFIDVINKKLVLVNTFPSIRTEKIDWFWREIHLKMLICALLNGTDFRKKNILNHLSEISLEIKKPIQTYLDLTLANKFIPYDVYEQFLYEIKAYPLFSKLIRLDNNQLRNNFLENNIAQLPMYYSSILLSRINSFIYDIGNEIEPLIHHMIINNKLPSQTTIDQIRGVVVFGQESPSHDKVNSHIKDVAELINDISNQHTDHRG